MAAARRRGRGNRAREERGRGKFIVEEKEQKEKAREGDRERGSETKRAVLGEEVRERGYFRVTGPIISYGSAVTRGAFPSVDLFALPILTSPKRLLPGIRNNRNFTA